MSPLTLNTPPKPEKLLFLKKFIRHGKRVASFAPSSRSLAKAMCLGVTPYKPQVIIELGAGTGAVTSEVARYMHPESHLLAIEIDPTFARHLQHAVPQARVVVADVSTLPQVLMSCGLSRFDLLLNGLPTPSLPKSVNRVVLETFAKLSPGGTFSQLTIMPWVYKPTYVRLFEKVRFHLVIKNAPPGGVYHCQQLRPDWEHHVPGTD
ncbi:MAG: phospholipid methyltransferase [Phycisphaerae bacterium]|jgi:phosphatidylethanolamine/phosphatidyl-N-methylethanolamine N-methyltransferase|nr:MAG: phospholipid methyltransferase [Phycisphaerae bacterium]